jgi:hypothetical protein
MDLKHLKAKAAKAAAKHKAESDALQVRAEPLRVVLGWLCVVLVVGWSGLAGLLPVWLSMCVGSALHTLGLSQPGRALGLAALHSGPPSLSLAALAAPTKPTHRHQPATAQALEADVARWQAEIPADEVAAEAAGDALSSAESQLEALQEGIKGEVEGHHQALTKVVRKQRGVLFGGVGGWVRVGLCWRCAWGCSCVRHTLSRPSTNHAPTHVRTALTRPKVRAELAPWEAQMAEVQSRMDVATSERDLLLQQQQEAKGEGGMAAGWRAVGAACVCVCVGRSILA